MDQIIVGFVDQETLRKSEPRRYTLGYNQEAGGKVEALCNYGWLETPNISKTRSKDKHEYLHHS